MGVGWLPPALLWYFIAMSDSKKSFVLYTDMIHNMKKLSKEQLGELFMMILEHENGNKEVTTEDILVDFAFGTIKLQLDRDANKYKQFIEKQRDNGKRGGRPKKASKSQKTQPLNKKPKKAYNDTDSVTDNDTETETPKNRKKGKQGKTENGSPASVGVGAREAEVDVWPTFDDFWDAYDKKTGREPCEKKWKKLKQSDKEGIMRHVPAYVESTPDKSFRKNPQTYLNQKTWTDEEIITKNTFDNGQQDLNNLDPKEVAAYVRSVFSE
jgi:hypothetical protein